MSRVIEYPVTREQAEMLDSMGKLVHLQREAAEGAERDFRLAARAMLAGHVPAGGVTGIDVDRCVVIVEIEDEDSPEETAE